LKSTVIIAGAGRSGTTWVLDSLADANHMRTVFEPLHPVGVPAAAPIAYQYIEAAADAPESRTFMEQVFSGRMHSLWANYRIRPDRFNPLNNSPISVYLHAKKSAGLLKTLAFRRGLSGQAVKFIRANLMLPWLTRQFGLPTILVVRHPCAVIASRFKLSAADWSAEKAVSRYRDNRIIYEMIGDKFGFDLARPMSMGMALASVWCVENVLPLEWAEQEKYGVVAYEDLLVHPETEWRKVVGHLGLTGIPGSELLETPSQQSSIDMREKTFTPAHIERWKSQLGPDVLDDVGSILEQFSVKFYAIANAMPIHSVKQANR
jgi:hypothetical protein